MPLNPVTVGPVVRSGLAAAGLLGTGSSQLALGLTNALCTYGTTAMNVMTIDVGTVGAGKGTGLGVMVPQPLLLASLTANLPAKGIAGLSMPQMALGISIAYSTALAMAIINTMHPSVGVGSGKLQIMPNTLPAIGIFSSAFLAAGMTGQSVPQLAAAVATALDNVLPSAIGIVAIAGPPSISPSSGMGKGTLI